MYDIHLTINLMMDTKDINQEPSLPFDVFVDHVKDALAHLYNLRYLQQHILVTDGVLDNAQGNEIAAHQLRQELVEAIELLNPGRELPVQSKPVRIYNLLILHYVQGLTVREAAYELGVSERHAHRELRSGEKDVAEILWNKRSSSIPSDQDKVFIDEFGQTESKPGPTDLNEIVQSGVDCIQVLLDQHETNLDIVLSPSPLKIRTIRMLAEQLIISLLSFILNKCQPSHLLIEIQKGDMNIVSFSYSTERKIEVTPEKDTTINQLMGKLGWKISKTNNGYQQHLTIHISKHQPTILVIDDNEGLVELIKRSIESYGYRVIGALDGESGISIAKEQLPEAIILDVMMPGMHGWKVLQRLKNRVKTSKIPVIICSVIENKDLANALGASLYISKPIQQKDIVDAVAALNL